MSEHTVNIPQLLAVVLIGFLAFRWFFSSPSSTSRSGASDGRTVVYRINQAHVEQLAQMFPQLGRREIAWDLQRNGGSVAATTERVLSGRPLDPPPVTFQLPPSSNSTGTGGRNGAALGSSKRSHQDLITRYNLSSKLKSSAPNDTATDKKFEWSSSKSERQQTLQRRREEMILAARRKMEERDQCEAEDRR